MAKLSIDRGTALRWLGIVALCAAPTLIRYELTSAGTFACTRDGSFAGTCHAEPTLRQQLGLDPYWQVSEGEAPRPWFMPAMRIEDIGMATPSGGDHWLGLQGSPSCWSAVAMSAHGYCPFAYGQYSIPLDESYSPSDERRLAVELNTFLQKQSVRSFRLRQPGPFRPEYALFYLVAAIAAVFTFRRTLALRTAAWVEAAEAIPASRITAYRG